MTPTREEGAGGRCASTRGGAAVIELAARNQGVQNIHISKYCPMAMSQTHRLRRCWNAKPPFASGSRREVASPTGDGRRACG